MTRECEKRARQRVDWGRVKVDGREIGEALRKKYPPATMDVPRGGPAAWVPVSKVSALRNQSRCRVTIAWRVAGKVAAMVFIKPMEAFVSKVYCRRLSRLGHSKDHTISSQFESFHQAADFLIALYI
jgi:hypothetical protein